MSGRFRVAAAILMGMTMVGVSIAQGQNLAMDRLEALNSALSDATTWRASR